MIKTRAAYKNFVNSNLDMYKEKCLLNALNPIILSEKHRINTFLMAVANQDTYAKYFFGQYRN